MRRLGKRRFFLFLAPLLEDLPHLFPEILAYDDVKHGVEDAIEQGQVSEELVADLHHVGKVAPRDDAGTGQHVQGGGDVERHPADEEGQEDHEHQGGGPPLRPLGVDPLDGLHAQRLDDLDDGQRDDQERDHEAEHHHQAVAQQRHRLVPIVQRAGVHRVLRDVLHPPVNEVWDAQQQTEAPHHQAAQLSVLGTAHLAVGHGVHQRHVAVDANQHQQVDAAVEVEFDAQVDGLAQELAEGPVELVDDVDGPEWQAAHQHQVGHGQIAEVDLGHRGRLLVEQEDGQDEDVEHDAQRRDEQDVGRLPGVEPLPQIGGRLTTPGAVGVERVSIRGCGVEAWGAVVGGGGNEENRKKVSRLG